MYQLLHRLFNSLFVAVVCCLSFFYDFPSVIYSYSIYCFPLFLSLSLLCTWFVRSLAREHSLSFLFSIIFSFVSYYKCITNSSSSSNSSVRARLYLYSISPFLPVFSFLSVLYCTLSCGRLLSENKQKHAIP